MLEDIKFVISKVDNLYIAGEAPRDGSKHINTLIADTVSFGKETIFIKTLS